MKERLLYNKAREEGSILHMSPLYSFPNYIGIFCIKISNATKEGIHYNKAGKKSSRPSFSWDSHTDHLSDTGNWIRHCYVTLIKSILLLLKCIFNLFENVFYLEKFVISSASTMFVQRKVIDYISTWSSKWKIPIHFFIDSIVYSIDLVIILLGITFKMYNFWNL